MHEPDRPGTENADEGPVRIPDASLEGGVRPHGNTPPGRNDTTSARSDAISARSDTTPGRGDAPPDRGDGRNESHPPSHDSDTSNESTPLEDGGASLGHDAGMTVLAASADGIIAVDERGIVRLCNPAAEELFDRPAGELVGTPFGHPVAAGITEVDLLLPDGRRRVVELRTSTATVRGERLRVAALRDITRQRQFEVNLRTALERQNLAVAVAAHELSYPLAEISNLVDTLRDLRSREDARSREAAGEREDQRDILDRIADHTAHVQALLRKLLITSRLEAAVERPPKEEVRALDVILERLASFPDRAWMVRVSCDSDLMVLVDRAALSEMLINYLENAFAYGSPPIDVSARAADDHAEIQVCDNGPGVPERFIPYLFERFTREPGTSRQAAGTGLGLWIVRSLAQANGGDAWYERRERKSCFMIRLPRVPATATSDQRSGHGKKSDRDTGQYRETERRAEQVTRRSGWPRRDA